MFLTLAGTWQLVLGSWHCFWPKSKSQRAAGESETARECLELLEPFDHMTLSPLGPEPCQGLVSVGLVAGEYYQHVIGTVQDTFKTNKTFAQKYQNFCRLFRFVLCLVQPTSYQLTRTTDRLLSSAAQPTRRLDLAETRRIQGTRRGNDEEVPPASRTKVRKDG